MREKERWAVIQWTKTPRATTAYFKEFGEDEYAARDFLKKERESSAHDNVVLVEGSYNIDHVMRLIGATVVGG